MSTAIRESVEYVPSEGGSFMIARWKDSQYSLELHWAIHRQGTAFERDQNAKS
jgi:hypothetical protein